MKYKTFVQNYIIKSFGPDGAEGGEGGAPMDPSMGGEAPPEMASAAPNMEVEASYKQAAAKKGAANKNVRDYIQEVLERSRR